MHFTVHIYVESPVLRYGSTYTNPTVHTHILHRPKKREYDRSPHNRMTACTSQYTSTWKPPYYGTVVCIPIPQCIHTYIHKSMITMYYNARVAVPVVICLYYLSLYHTCMRQKILHYMYYTAKLHTT
jgi:hypothetical protein